MRKNEKRNGKRKFQAKQIKTNTQAIQDKNVDIKVHFQHPHFKSELA